MRVIVIQQAADLKTLQTMLFKSASSAKPGARSDSAMERIKALNPHIDFQRIPAHSTLLLPDDDAIHADDTRPLDDDALANIGDHLHAGLDAVAGRGRVNAKAQASEWAAVTKVAQSAAVARQLNADPQLKAQWTQASEAAALEQKKADAAVQQMGAMQAMAEEELRTLQELLRHGSLGEKG